MGDDDQIGLFDPLPSPEEATKQGIEGLAQSVGRSGSEWVEYANDFVHTYLFHHSTLFCDDVWVAGLERPASPRAFGQVMKNAKKQGWMIESGEMRKTRQGHMTLRVVYDSLVFKGSRH